MSHAGSSLQTAIYNRLNDQISQTVFSAWVNDSAVMPYVVIGDIQTEDGDTNNTDGEIGTFEIHAFDKDVRSRATINAMLADIHDALHRQHANITPTGFVMTYCYREFSTAFAEVSTTAGEDSYYHGLMRFRYRLQSTA